MGHNMEEGEEETDIAGDLDHNVEEEEEVTDGPLEPAVVGKAVEGEGDATLLAVLPDTAGPAGRSVVDKVVGGDGDATVLEVLPVFGGEGGTKPARSEWGGPTGSPPTLKTPLMMDLLEYTNNNLQSEDGHLQGMTVTRPDKLTSVGSDKWFFEFEWNTEGEGNVSLSDTDTITSAASEETLKMHKPKWHLQCSTLEGSTLEDHELGPGPKPNTGPPFAVGDIIVCGTRGTSGLQRAFVLLADHPKYWLCLEEGKTIGTHVGEA
jgi:hypothetical protein